MARRVRFSLGCVFFLLLGAGFARADNIHLCNVDPTTVCNAGSVIGTTSTTAYVFGTTASGQTLSVAILVPLTGSAGNFNANTSLWSVLGVNNGQNFPNFSSAASQEGGFTGITPGSFSASSLPIGAWTGSVTNGQTITLPNEPTGTIFVAYLTDAQGNLIAASPWSSSLIVPEPSSGLLLIAGLFATGAIVVRSRRQRTALSS